MILGCWIVFLLCWIVDAAATQKTAERQSALQKCAHVIPVLIGVELLYR